MKNNNKQQRRQSRDIPPINRNIRFPKIRLISPEGEQLGILTPDEGRRLADERDLDLVLVSDKADPPVCRIMDYGKYKYEQDRRAREARKKQHSAEVKEVKMRYKIDDHDYEVRINQAKRFLKSGDKVKATVTFRGREIQHADLAETLLRRMATDLSELAELQQLPKREGRNMNMLLSPRKSDKDKDKEPVFTPDGKPARPKLAKPAKPVKPAKPQQVES
ncbi:translation initiation factor IF-3 [Rubidibacter lacunae KORDI 51-2]|uniref:Translation initiation factor IF-3 n=1 Tax=Rubidibacter lacunae KORDI 51-2 TaxID=582515 RepID=U5DMN1_9CHRO|nr:translation initiation factor IF-3 [Rubidibacter lacunae KORDI 51-2]